MQTPPRWQSKRASETFLSCIYSVSDRKLISSTSRNLNSAIVTICVGPDQRLFAAHEDVLCVSPYFSACCRGQFFESHTKRINLPNEQPEILSSILEYLYKGDYYPRLMHNKRRDTWLLEDTDTTGSRPSAESTIINQADGTLILKDTAI